MIRAISRFIPQHKKKIGTLILIPSITYKIYKDVHKRKNNLDMEFVGGDNKKVNQNANSYSGISDKLSTMTLF